MQKLLITRDIVAKASRAVTLNGVTTGTMSRGVPATAKNYNDAPETHCLTGILERVAGTRLYNSKKGGWYTTSGEFENRKALNEAAAVYAWQNPTRFKSGGIKSLEQLNDSAINPKETVQDFLNFVYRRINNKGVVSTEGFPFRLV